VDIAKAAEWSDTPRTFDQKYGAMATTVAKLGEEFLSKMDLAPAL
jgi:predicted regulator of Ras-like GTPase activity (Roadblock/LC7/MglB family)